MPETMHLLAADFDNFRLPIPSSDMTLRQLERLRSWSAKGVTSVANDLTID